jgi:hypothetical protein
MKKQAHDFKKYNRIIAVNLAVFSACLLSAALIMEQLKLLTAPQFLASISFDEKARFFKQVKPKNPALIAVGSSIAVNHVDSVLLKDSEDKQIPFTNFASYGLQVTDLKNLVGFSMALSGKPNTVLVLSAPVDLMYCSPDKKTNAHYVSLKSLHQEDAVNYIKSDLPAVYYHAKYRTLWRMLDPNLTAEVRRQRTTNNTLDSLKFDSSGSVLLEVPKENIPPGRWEGKPMWANVMSQLDKQDTCYQSLAEFAKYLKQNNMNLVFTLSPIRQGYLNEFDPQRKSLSTYRERLKSILSQSNSLLLDAHTDLQLSDEYFVDAFHLNKKGSQVLTQYISQQLNQNQMQLARRVAK